MFVVYINYIKIICFVGRHYGLQEKFALHNGKDRGTGSMN
jgi:hypothetical protein